MRYHGVSRTRDTLFFILFLLFNLLPAHGQELTKLTGVVLAQSAADGQSVQSISLPQTASGSYTTQALIRLALVANGELTAARLDIERARGRLRQAGLRSNPTAEAERTAGVLNSPGERNLAIGVTIPLELNGQRQRRMEVAQTELAIAQADIADRERRLASEVRTLTTDILTATRELEILTDLGALDAQSVKIASDRVAIGDIPPLDLNLLKVEQDRRQARRMLVEVQLKIALGRLKILVGLPVDAPLRLAESLASTSVPSVPDSVETSITTALRLRPDLQMARLNEESATARVRLARAQGRPDVTAYTRYAANESSFDTTPIGFLNDRDKLLTFGLSVTIPVFNRNQGAKAEAEVAITQAKRRREFLEQLVRNEVTAAYDRWRVAKAVLDIYKTGVIDRSQQNLHTIRNSYEVGAFRITEVIAEQRKFADVQQEYTEILAEYQHAWKNLVTAIGNPLD